MNASPASPAVAPAAVVDWVGLYNMGAQLFNAGRTAEAEAHFRQAAAAQPGHPTIRVNHGLALKILNRRQEALEAFSAALRADPNHPDALHQTAQLFMEAGRAADALPLFRRLIAVRPDHPGALLGLGNAFMQLDDPYAAERAYRPAAALVPNGPNEINNLGAAVLSQCRLADAAPLYRRSVRLNPASPEYHKNLGCCQLMAGDFAEGGPEYEWRERQAVWPWRRDYPGKLRWDGEASIAGKTFLIHFEQGIGDTFQFIRYARLLKEKGARVIFECQKPLKRFLTGLPFVDVLVGHGEPLPDFDVHAPLMSLPWLCRVSPETIPNDAGYLKAEPKLVAKWARRMERREFRVGINWQANAENRSIPLETFEAMAAIPGVRLYSLQKVAGLEHLQRLRDRLGIIDWTSELDAGPDAFVDTAAVMTNMDLIISCDSAVNHLAGSMGLPCILVLRWFADWRWMRIPETSPYYPTMRLFRMQRRNDWPEVMARVTEEVARRAAAAPAAAP